MREIKHSVKYSSGIGTIAGMTALIAIETASVIRAWDRWNVLKYALLAGVPICVAVLSYALYRTVKQPTETEFSLFHDHVLLNGHTIRAGDMKAIKIKGYFRPVIGILPYGKKVVPLNMAFRFSKEEDRGISDLNKWAERNHVKMVSKSFKTWI